MSTASAAAPWDKPARSRLLRRASPIASSATPPPVTLLRVIKANVTPHRRAAVNPAGRWRSERDTSHEVIMSQLTRKASA